MNNVYITEQEKREYLAYHTYQDVLDNLQSGLRELEKLPLEEYKGKVSLVCGAMVAFDRGLTDFLNRCQESRKDLFLLSEVTAQHRRYTRERVRFPFICTPHLLAKEMLIQGMAIPIEEAEARYVRGKRYLREAVWNLNSRHRNLGENYASVWCYYADRYIRRLLERLAPREVILWNEFYAFHHIFQGVCREKRIPLSYMEFGCIPGTICMEKNGQQGESDVARAYKRFRKLPVSEEELRRSGEVISFLKESALNRNLQPEKGFSDAVVRYYKAGRKTVLYLGQNDYEAGMCPYTGRTKRYHSPVFETSLAALEFLRILALRNDWNLIFKPHPIMYGLGYGMEDGKEGVDQITDADINSLIDRADVVVTILSQGAYIALTRGKPVVMLGYMQLKGKLCTYEAYRKNEIERRICEALERGFTAEQERNFVRHVAQLLKYVLYDDMTEREIRFGKELEIM